MTPCTVRSCSSGAECRCYRCGTVVCRQHARKVAAGLDARGDVVYGWLCHFCLGVVPRRRLWVVR